MKRLIIGAAVAGLLIAVPAAFAQPQPAANQSDLLIRIHGPVTVSPTDSLGTVIVVGNDVFVNGTVEDLVVINGFARIDGKVRGNLTLINGSGAIGSRASIGKNVLLYRSAVTREQGASVRGEIHDEMGVSFGARAVWFLWASTTIALIAIALLLTSFGRESLARAGDVLRTDWSRMLVATVMLVSALPLLAVVSFMTGVGFVLGFFILLVLIPALTVAGYVVAATAVGHALFGNGVSRSGAFGIVALGMVLMQLIAAIPAVGGIIAIVASQLGAGALASETWRQTRQPGTSPVTALPQPA